MGKENGEEKKRRMKIVATMSLPAVDRPKADRWNAARSRQKHCIYSPIHVMHTMISSCSEFFDPVSKFATLEIELYIPFNFIKTFQFYGQEISNLTTIVPYQGKWASNKLNSPQSGKLPK